MWYLLITDERTNETTRTDLVNIVSSNLPLDHQLDYVRSHMVELQSYYYRFESVSYWYQYTDRASYEQFNLPVPNDAVFGSFYGTRSRKLPR